MLVLPSLYIINNKCIWACITSTAWYEHVFYVYLHIHTCIYNICMHVLIFIYYLSVCDTAVYCRFECAVIFAIITLNRLMYFYPYFTRHKWHTMVKLPHNYSPNLIPAATPVKTATALYSHSMTWLVLIYTHRLYWQHQHIKCQVYSNMHYLLLNIDTYIILLLLLLLLLYIIVIMYFLLLLYR